MECIERKLHGIIIWIHYAAVISYQSRDLAVHVSAGLLITYVALNLMDGHGQPALLYIVPFTLGK